MVSRKPSGISQIGRFGETSPSGSAETVREGCGKNLEASNKEVSDWQWMLNLSELLGAALGKSPRPDSDVTLIAKKAGKTFVLRR